MEFLGVDLAWGQGQKVANETGLVLLDEHGTVLQAGWARGVEDVAAWMAEHAVRPNVLAFVDAPLVVTSATGQRVCEKQVGQRYGRWRVSANSTNIASVNAAGVALLEVLQAAGWEYSDGLAGPPTTGRHVSECYPYTTLVGTPGLGYTEERPRYKRRPRGLAAAQWKPERAAAFDDLIGRMAGLADADPPLDLMTHPVTRLLIEEPSPLDDGAYKHREDLLDAALCAWTAALWYRHGFEQCQVLGDPNEHPYADTIIAPARPDQRR